MSKTLEQMAEQYADDKSRVYYIGENGEKKWYINSRGQHSKEDFLAGYKAAQDQLADVSKVMPQWLSVKDRLPEINTGFIGFVENKEVCNCYRYPDSLRDGSPVFYAQSKAGLFICSLESVSHWQPLPAPPKEEK